VTERITDSDATTSFWDEEKQKAVHFSDLNYKKLTLRQLPLVKHNNI